jgi:hypothetical protein
MALVAILTTAVLSAAPLPRPTEVRSSPTPGGAASQAGRALPVVPMAPPVSLVLVCIRRWESLTSGLYHAVSPGGRYRGAYQFDVKTWAGVGGSGDPAAASPAEQDWRATVLIGLRGLAPWPTPARMCA